MHNGGGLLCEREHAFYGLINTLYTFGVWEVEGVRKQIENTCLHQLWGRDRLERWEKTTLTTMASHLSATRTQTHTPPYYTEPTAAQPNILLGIMAGPRRVGTLVQHDYPTLHTLAHTGHHYKSASFANKPPLTHTQQKKTQTNVESA